MLKAGFAGGAQLRYVATIVERQRQSGLRKELSQAHRDAFRPLEPAIKAEAGLTLPSRGGYGPLMAKTVRVSARRRGLETTAIVFARGAKGERHVAAVNRGDLAHPVFGRTRRLKSGKRMRNPWVHQVVRPGFVSRPVDELGERIATESLDALARVAREISR